MKKMALRLHMDKNIGDAFITFYVAFIRRLRCVYEKNGVAFTHREKKIGDAFITFYVAFIRRLRCVYRNRKQKCNLPPLVILVVVRELFRLGLDVMEPFSCSYSLLLGGE